MKGFRGIAFRVWMCAVVGQVLALLALTDVVKDVRHHEAESQLETMVSRVLGQASARAALGYPLEFQAELQQLIDDLVLTAKRGADIYILDAEGAVIFASEHDRVGAKAPQAWLPAKDTDERWARTTDSALVYGAEIVNAFAARSGMVVARTLRTTLLAEVIAAMRLPVMAAIVALALAGVLAMLGTSLAVRPIARRIAFIEARYRAAGDAVRKGRRFDVEDAGSSVKAVRDAVDAVADVERRATSLDRLATVDPKSRHSSGGSESRAGEAAA